MGHVCQYRTKNGGKGIPNLAYPLIAQRNTTGEMPRLKNTKRPNLCENKQILILIDHIRILALIQVLDKKNGIKGYWDNLGTKGIQSVYNMLFLNDQIYSRRRLWLGSEKLGLMVVCRTRICFSLLVGGI